MTEYLLDRNKLRASLLAAAAGHADGPACFLVPGSPIPPGEDPCVSKYPSEGDSSFFLRLSGPQVASLVANVRLHKFDIGPMMHAFCSLSNIPLLGQPLRAKTAGKAASPVSRCRYRSEEALPLVVLDSLGLSKHKTWIECHRGLGPVGPGGPTCLCDCNPTRCRWYERPAAEDASPPRVPAKREAAKDQAAKPSKPTGVPPPPAANGKPFTDLEIRNDWALGDTICIASAIRDLHLAYPGRFRTAFTNHYLSFWTNCLHRTPLSRMRSPRYVDLATGSYIANRERMAPRHFSTIFHVAIERQLGVRVPVTKPHGELYMRPGIAPPVAGRYWLVIAGGKTDMTNKWWPVSRYAEVVERLRRCGIQCVQAGFNGGQGKHTQLKGVPSLVDRTPDIADFFAAIRGADGVICGVTGAMHAAAALGKPCVVIGGGREQWWWEAYTNDGQWPAGCEPVKVPHKYLHTQGLLPCCRKTGCWIASVDASPGQGQCHRPEREDGRNYAACMRMITVDHVVDAVAEYVKEGFVNPIGQPSRAYFELPVLATPEPVVLAPPPRLLRDAKPGVRPPAAPAACDPCQLSAGIFVPGVTTLAFERDGAVITWPLHGDAPATEEGCWSGGGLGGSAVPAQAGIVRVSLCETTSSLADRCDGCGSEWFVTPRLVFETPEGLHEPLYNAVVPDPGYLTFIDEGTGNRYYLTNGAPTPLEKA